MSNAMGSGFKWSFLGVTLLVGAVLAWRMQGQSPPSIRVGGVEINGIPEDWSNHSVVFSDPGTEQEAIHGDYAQWQRIVNEPRYVVQQLKRNARVQGPAAADAEFRSWWLSHAIVPATPLEAPEEFGPPLEFRAHPFRPIQPPHISTDWSLPLGGPGLKEGHYPAKFSFSPTSASCTDYVVFPTGAVAPTGSTTLATITAFTNIYAGAGGCPGAPTVKFAYNTSSLTTPDATTNLSPVLSLDGSQVAFIQTSGTTASLVLLKMATSGGVVMSPMRFDMEMYRGCTAPCYTTIPLNGSPADTNSAPFYRYDGSDTLYVGDDSGKLHRFTGVFNGNPTETGTGTPWPVQMTSGTGSGQPTNSMKLTSPVYDFQTGPLSPRVWVSDGKGFLMSLQVNSTSAAIVGTNTTSNQLDCSNSGNIGNPSQTQVDLGLQDPPLVDVTKGTVYVFIAYSCSNSSVNGNAVRSSFASQFDATDVTMFGKSNLAYNNGTTNTPSPSSNIARLGAFDNKYLSGSNGNLYACVNGQIFQLPVSADGSLVQLNQGGGRTSANTFSTPVSTVGPASACSPVTEFLGTKSATTLNGNLNSNATTATFASTAGMALNDFLQIDSEIMQVTHLTPTPIQLSRGQLGTTAAAHTAGTAVLNIQDGLYVSVRGNASFSGCTGACLYSWDVLNVGPMTPTVPNNQNLPPKAALSLSNPVPTATAATSGIILDNRSTTQNGARQIYFGTRTSTSSAMQASQ